jgi:hypothetical protein
MCLCGEGDKEEKGTIRQIPSSIARESYTQPRESERERVSGFCVKLCVHAPREMCNNVSSKNDRSQKRNRGKRIWSDADSGHGLINKKIHAASDFIYSYCCVFLRFIHAFFFSLYHFRISKV